MKAFYLPIEEREENLERASHIAYNEAEYEGQPVYTDFMDVPMVATTHDTPPDIRANWQKLFEQLQATPQTTQAEVEESIEELEPATPVKPWHDKWWGILIISVFCLVVLFNLGRGVQGWFEDWDKGHPKPEAHSDTVDGFTSQNFAQGYMYWQGDPQLMAFDAFTDAIWINVDEWKLVHACSPEAILNMSETVQGGPHGNTRIKLTPYCEDRGVFVVPDASK